MLVTHVRLVILKAAYIVFVTWHVRFTFRCTQTKGAAPFGAPPLLCQLNKRILQTYSLNVWGCFLSDFTCMVPGHTVCRSAKQFASALSLHARVELTAKVKYIVFREWLISLGEPGGGTGFASTSSNIYLAGYKGCFHSSSRSHLYFFFINGQFRPPVCLSPDYAGLLVSREGEMLRDISDKIH